MKTSWPFATWPPSRVANPFLENYSGSRFPATDHAVILMEAPEDQSPIGRSAFIATQVLGDEEALAAAQEVGARSGLVQKLFEFNHRSDNAGATSDVQHHDHDRG